MRVHVPSPDTVMVPCEQPVVVPFVCDSLLAHRFRVVVSNATVPLVV